MTQATDDGTTDKQRQIAANIADIRTGGLASQLAAVTAERDNALRLLDELHAVVKGECPSLLNEDSGGDAELAWNIEKALTPKEPS